MSNLNERFHAFCRQFPGVVDIDAIPLTEEQKALHLQKADFLFEDNIICEIKIITADRSQQLLKFMAENGINLDGLLSGDHIIEDLFSQLPNGEDLYRRATDIIMKPVADDFDEAERQIRDTKQLLKLSDADGLFILLNEIAELAGHSLIKTRLEQRLNKLNDAGEPYHKDITTMLHIGEMNQPQSQNKHINMTLSNPLATEHHGVNAFVYKLAEAWADFCGQTFEKASPEIGELINTSKLYIRVP